MRRRFPPLLKFVLAGVTVLTLGAAQGSVDGATAIEGGGLMMLSGVIWNGFASIKNLIVSVDKLNETVTRLLEKASKPESVEKS